MPEPPAPDRPPEPHGHAPRSWHRWMDMAVGVSAIAISVISLFVAIGHGKTEERLLAASSWPFLVAQSSENGLTVGARILNIRLENSGVGPARVQTVRVMLDGHAVHDRAELMARCCNVPAGSLETQVQLGLVTQNEPIGVLPARDGVDVLGWRELPGNQAIWNNLNAARHRLRFEACFCSVLDECWRSDLIATTHPRSVAFCPAIPDGYAG